MAYDFGVRAIAPQQPMGADDASFDYAARALELANGAIAQIGSFSPYAVVALEKNGANARVIPFQDQTAALAAFKLEADALSAQKAYVGVFDTNGNIRERYYGWGQVVDATIKKLAPLAVPILIVGGLIGAAVIYRRSSKSSSRRPTRRRAAFRRRTVTTWGR